MTLKEMLKELIQQQAPKVLSLQAQISDMSAKKGELQAQIEKINAAEAELKEELSDEAGKLLSPLKAADVAKVITADYIVERKVNANPTVEVVNIDQVPSEWQVLKPRVDKRGIQSHFVKTGIIVPGVAIEQGQHLIVKSRKEKEHGTQLEPQSH